MKLLAMAPGHRMHREQAMDLLWPASGRKAASNNLRQALHAARRILASDPSAGSRYLGTEADSLVLCPKNDLWVDVEVFEEAAATAQRAKEPAAYRAALNLYAGVLLPGDLYEEWTEERRGELHKTYLSLLVELSRLYEQREDLGLAIEALQRAVVGEPTHEEAHTGLIRLYALSGRPGKALAHYERLREDLLREYATEPGAEIQRIYEEVLSGRISPARSSLEGDRPAEEPTSAAAHNLPAARTSFVGREREMREIQRELTMTRLLTLTGPGGTGKTRLALEVAKDLVGTYPDGVWLVELAGLSEEGLVTQTVADVLGVEENPDQSPRETLVNFLDEKRVLLVLDNCEHLLRAAAHLTHALLDSCPRLRVLATSREALGVAGEMDRPVPTLSLPDAQAGLTVEELESYESVRLFEDRALFVERSLYGSSGFALTPENARAVAHICWRLEGMPLAIELAAAWVGTLTAAEIWEKLESSLRLLKSGSQVISARQRTLRGAMDWSYSLLGEAERALFRRLSVFVGGWVIEASEAVGVDDDLEKEEVLELLWRLVNKSLVLAVSRTEGSARYRMLEPIRQYASDKLEESGEAEDVRDRHATFYLTLAEVAGPELAGPRQSAWVERLEGEHDNLRAALSWILRREEGELGLRFGAALWRFWHNGGHLSEGERWLADILARSSPQPTRPRVKALEGMGWLLQIQGDHERAQATYEEMLTLSRELGDKGNLATALNSLGTLAAVGGDNERARALLDENLLVLRQLEGEGDPDTPLKKFYVFNLLGALALNEAGDYARAETLLEESLALAREVADEFLVGITLSNLGHAALMQRSYERAREYCEEALTIAHELGSGGVEIIPQVLVNLGLASLGLGEYERARTFFEEALMMGQNSGQKPKVIESLEGMASLAGVLREATRAAHLWGAAEAAREATGIALSPGERALHEPYLASARPQLGKVVWEEALAEGRAMSLDEAAEYALSEVTNQTEPTIGQDLSTQAELMGNLTHREREVVVLVARGLTNRQISTELSISERTAGNHVAKILRKLGLSSRAQIAARAEVIVDATEAKTKIAPGTITSVE